MLCKPISVQLAGLVSKECGRKLDRDNQAINRCVLQGYMTPAIAERARKKLLKQCQAAVQSSKPEKDTQ